MKVLNLYAGIGGNRKLWGNVDVTAVEHDSEVANVYSHFYPNDRVVVADAHAYLLNHYKEFDFIWSSPPLPESQRYQTDGRGGWSLSCGVPGHKVVGGNNFT